MKKIYIGFISFCLLFTVFSVFTANVAAQPKKDIRKAKNLKDDGDKAFRQKNYKIAVEKYAESIVLVPNVAEPHFWKGYAHYYLNEYDQALTEVNAAEKLNFNKPIEIYKIRYFLNLKKENFSDAEVDINKVLSVEPNNFEFLIASGDVNFAKKDYRSALNAYKKALPAKPNNGDLLYLIAACHFNLGEISEQGIAADKSIKNGTKYIGEAFALLGDSHQKSKKYPEAIEAYKQAINSKQDNYAVYRSLADIYRTQSRFDDAIKISKDGLRIYPNDGNFYTDLSWYYSLANRHQDAIDAAKAAITFLPNQSLAYTNICRAYNDTAQYSLAVNSCTKALQLNPNDGETYFYLGRAYQYLGKNADAAKAYDKSVDGLIEFTKQNPDYSDGYYLLGNAYLANSNFVKAGESYLKCLSISPRFAKARYNLGLVYVLKKEKSSATDQYNALLNLDKDLAGKLKAEIDKK